MSRGIADALADAGRSILQAVGMRRSPLQSLGDDSPVGLAEQLLWEIERGMQPVWPTTEEYAERLVDGLLELRETRSREVVRARLVAPHLTPMEWPERLRVLGF